MPVFRERARTTHARCVASSTRSSNVRSRAALLALATGAVLAISWIAATTSFAGFVAPSAAAAKLGLTRYTIQRIRASAGTRTTSVALQLAGRRVTLKLEPKSLRASGFRLLTPGANGELVEVEAPAPLTYRGTVVEMPGAVVGATIRDGMLNAAVALPDGGLFYVQPVEDGVGGEGAVHAVYSADSAVVEGTCAANEPAVPVAPTRSSAEEILAAPRVTQLAIDADYDLFVRNASSLSLTMTDVETVMNAVNVVYERDCNITHQIVTVIVRNNEADPYAATEPGAALTELRSWWNSQHTGIQRDLVHLMTGRDLDGSTIGIASVGVVCNKSYGYGLSQTRFSTTMSRRAALTAHELAHNWNASHCDGAAECRIMCSSLGGCNGLGLPNFEPQGIQSIQSFAASRTCLDSPPVMAVGPGSIETGLVLAPARPTPFTRATTLSWYLAVAGPVRLAIYDVAGKRVALLTDGGGEAGWNTRTWDGLDEHGNPVHAGAYYARLETPGGTRSQKMLLVR